MREVEDFEARSLGEFAAQNLAVNSLIALRQVRPLLGRAPFVTVVQAAALRNGHNPTGPLDLARVG